jgi:hypothetical protein
MYTRVGRSVTQCSPIEDCVGAGTASGEGVAGSWSVGCSWASLSGALVALSI